MKPQVLKEFIIKHIEVITKGFRNPVVEVPYDIWVLLDAKEINGVEIKLHDEPEGFYVSERGVEIE